jgi:hypothetical protein
MMSKDGSTWADLARGCRDICIWLCVTRTTRPSERCTRSDLCAASRCRRRDR